MSNQETRLNSIPHVPSKLSIQVHEATDKSRSESTWELVKPVPRPSPKALCNDAYHRNSYNPAQFSNGHSRSIDSELKTIGVTEAVIDIIMSRRCVLKWNYDDSIIASNSYWHLR